MTVTKEMIEAAWKKYREGCLAVRPSKSDFMAGFEAALSPRDARLYSLTVENAQLKTSKDYWEKETIDLRASRSAEAGKPVVTANCCHCGRIIDTREISEGGDAFGAEMSDGRWTCSFECNDAVLGLSEPAKATNLKYFTDAFPVSALSTPADIEPVAWQTFYEEENRWVQCTAMDAEAIAKRGGKVRPLYAAPVAVREPVSVPEGVSNNRELLQALSRLADNRHSDGISSLVSREDSTAIINGCYDLMIAARAAAPQPNPSKVDVEGWQPIETAPKDGTKILAWSMFWDKHHLIRWNQGENAWCEGSWCFGADPDMVWFPLKSAPVRAALAAQGETP